ncbi:MBOAT family protein [Calycina marina]|uniref:MBOAT family protein n=1 Tax=Calycina marina TaxID=1763456 RepID=A0A9P8CIC6_9HELO|nr:MBOAT family protein [Calycina marina]
MESASQLIGQLNEDGTVQLEEDTSYTKAGALQHTRSFQETLNGSSGSSKDRGDNASQTSSEEDYDALKHDPTTVLQGAAGAGIGKYDGANTPEAYEEIKSSSSPRPSTARKKSIPIILSKLQEEGQYLLTADDAALAEILKLGLERERTAGSRSNKIRDLVFTRQFTAFDRQNAESADSPFRGFFTLFWLGTAIYMLKTAAENWRQHRNILGTNEIMGLYMSEDLLILGVSDGLLCATTGFGWMLQKLIASGFISWNKQGWVIQSVWELFYIYAVIEWTLFREWPWTHTVFFVMHGLIMLMKQHSYSFYNGHLSEDYKTRGILRKKLKHLENIAPAEPSKATKPPITRLSTAYLNEEPADMELKQRHQQRRASIGTASSTIAQVASAIDSKSPLDLDTIQMFERIIEWEIDALTADLRGKSTRDNNMYPSNLTIANHYEYIVLPTLVYELEYPRSASINWYYVAEKSVAVVGILGIMNMVSQTFIYPVVVRTIELKTAGLTIQQRLEQFPWILSDLIFPFMMEYMMSWYIIWECILNLLAELTYFADRGFYADWWNSVSWDQFARDWNRPVHNFLLRHVYHSSISSMKVNKYTATLITFFLSAIAHELVMWCLFKKLRGYLLLLQMMQLPLVQLSRTRWLKGRATLGNLMFWVGIFTGPSLLCSLYLII